MFLVASEMTDWNISLLAAQNYQHADMELLCDPVTRWPVEQGCSLRLEHLGLETVSRRVLERLGLARSWVLNVLRPNVSRDLLNASGDVSANHLFSLNVLNWINLVDDA